LETMYATMTAAKMALKWIRGGESTLLIMHEIDGVGHPVT